MSKKGLTSTTTSQTTLHSTVLLRVASHISHSADQVIEQHILACGLDLEKLDAFGHECHEKTLVQTCMQWTSRAPLKPTSVKLRDASSADLYALGTCLVMGMKSVSRRVLEDAYSLGPDFEGKGTPFRMQSENCWTGCSHALCSHCELSTRSTSKNPQT